MRGGIPPLVEAIREGSVSPSGRVAMRSASYSFAGVYEKKMSRCHITVRIEDRNLDSDTMEPLTLVSFDDQGCASVYISFGKAHRFRSDLLRYRPVVPRWYRLEPLY